MDVVGGQDKEGQNVQVYSKNTGIGQRWNIIYLDKKGKGLKKGQLNRGFGFYVERPFFIQSRLPMRRVLQVVGSNVVIKTLVRNRNTQKWVFDQKSKTITSLAYRNKCFDIQNSGRSANLHVATINSRWF